MSTERTAAMARYRRRLLGAMAVYALLIVLLLPIAKGDGPLWLKAASALLPVLPVLLALRELLRMLQSLDELERRQQFEATATAAVLTCMLTFAWGLLETAGFPRIPVVLVLPLFCALYGSALFVVCRRYG